MSDQVKYVLDESKLPEAWYNLASDLPEPLPPVLHPGTGQPVGPDDLAPLFPMQIILQEVSTERHIAIPEEIRDVYRQWRPTPLYRARRLEQALETPARIYYKYEGVSPTGSHKPNTAVAAGLLQQAGGRDAPHDRDGSGAVGLVARVRRAGVRPRGRGLHGQGVVRPEAVSAGAHGDVRRALRREPVRGDQLGSRHPRGASGLVRQSWDRDLRGRRDGRHPRRHEVLARLRPQPRAHAPVRDRRGGAGSARARRRLPGRRHRVHRRRVELRRDLVPVHRPARSASRRSCA